MGRAVLSVEKIPRSSRDLNLEPSDIYLVRHLLLYYAATKILIHIYVLGFLWPGLYIMYIIIMDSPLMYVGLMRDEVVLLSTATLISFCTDLRIDALWLC